MAAGHYFNPKDDSAWLCQLPSQVMGLFYGKVKWKLSVSFSSLHLCLCFLNEDLVGCFSFPRFKRLSNIWEYHSGMCVI